MPGVRVKLLVLLIFGWMFPETDAQQQTFLVVAPLSFRLDATEKVLVQLFGFSGPETVQVFVRKTMGHGSILQQSVTLSATNQHMGEVQLRLSPQQVDNTMDHVILHVQSNSLNQHMRVSLSRTNGFLLVQTDKPLYTPRQKVKVRVFSLNQELRPADRSVFLTFRDPESEKVDVVEVKDVSNGMPSLQNPFKIPINPKLGVWTIEASYIEDFDTKAITTFEVREYVLPSFTILIEPKQTYVSHNNFRRFSFKVSAKYLHSAPVALGEVYLRYGYVSLKGSPVILPSSIKRERLSPEGVLEVTEDLEKVFSKQNSLRTLNELKGKYLYIAVLLQEETGGISQEAELASVKFVKSPYTLGLVSTPLFIKPALPYYVQVLVKDHQGTPVRGVTVRLLNRQIHRSGRDPENLSCSEKATSSPEGIALFICNIQEGALSVDLQFETEDASLPAESQASLSLKAQSYESPNARYLYIDPNPIQAGVGAYTQVQVHSVGPPYLFVKSLNYLIMSKGKIIKYGWIPFGERLGNMHTVHFQVTAEMVPSIRLLVYYMPYGEKTTELVADAVWLNIQGECVNGLQTELKTRATHYKPQQNLEMEVKVNQDGFIAMTAVDTGIYSLRPNYKDPVNAVLRHIESTDQGCGGGGGRNAADVFKLAGLSIITNADSGHSSSSEPCAAIVRPKRAISEEQKAKILDQFRHPKVKDCCLLGMGYSPTFMTCAQFAQNKFGNNPKCCEAFRDCCLHIQKTLNQDYVLGRAELGGDFEKAPTLVRSSFPESWLWQVRRISGGSLSLTEKLPDSLTTWHIQTVGMFENGICVSKAAEVSVSLPLSLDVPLPYQIVRGEQVELRGSVYNQLSDSIKFCVTLTVGPELCLADSRAAADGSPLRSTLCDSRTLSAGGVGEVRFTLMALEPGEHTLTFKLLDAPSERTRTTLRPRDTLVKTLTVVPEGVLKEVMVGGNLDPRGIYGSVKRKVVLKSSLPQNVVPNTEVRRMLTISGEILDEWVTVVDNPEALKKLLSLKDGTAASELGAVLPLLHVYQYLETTGRWHILGPDIQKSSDMIKQRIREGLTGVSSFRQKDFSYSMFKNNNSSTWVTALAVQTLAMVNEIVHVDLESLARSVNWLTHFAKNPDGSFRDDSLYKPNKIMGRPEGDVERSVYLTSFVIVALHKATRIQKKELQLKSQEDAIQAAIKFVHKNMAAVQKVYVLSVAAYALTLHDPHGVTTSNLLERLERLAKQKGNPPELRYWQEREVQTEWLKPDQSSAQTVETTAYALLSFLRQGRFQYVNPIVTWLTQDQHYGGGHFSMQDMLVTLEAVTLYSNRVPRAVLDQYVRIEFSRQSDLDREVHLSKRAPVASPVQIAKNSEVTATTAVGQGVSHVKLKTVYYETVPPQTNCNFDIKMEILKSGSSDSSLRAPHLVACAQYKPPPNELAQESLLTVMEIQLPTGIEPFLDDLRPLRDVDDPIVASYMLNGRTVLVHLYAVPSDQFLCVGFRIRSAFVVGGASNVVFTVYEDQDQASKCTKEISDQELKVQRLCQFDQCQCVTAVCSPFRGRVDPTITQVKLTQEICRPEVKYAFKVKVTNVASEGDFLTHTATVIEVIKSQSQFGAVSGGTEVDFIKKTTCNTVDIQKNHQYLISGSSGLEVVNREDYRFRFPLDSEALVQVWPSDCGAECLELERFSLLVQLGVC